VGTVARLGVVTLSGAGRRAAWCVAYAGTVSCRIPASTSLASDRIKLDNVTTPNLAAVPLPTGLSAFTDREYFKGGTHPARMTFYGGPLWAARQRADPLGWTLIDGLVASAQPGGTTTRHAYETLRDELLDGIRRAMPLDMVLLGLHGARVADGYDDCEGDILSRVRAITGPGTSIGATLDPQAHLTQMMVDTGVWCMCGHRVIAAGA